MIGMLQKYFNQPFFLVIPYNLDNGTVNRQIYIVLTNKEGAKLRVKKSKNVAFVNLNTLNNTALPTESNVTKMIKLKINVKGVGSTYSNNVYIQKTKIGNKIKLIPNTL